VEWKEMRVGEVFSYIKRGDAKNIAKREKTSEGVALISAKDRNNGFNFATQPNNNETIYKDVLTINNNGSVGCSYYHPYNFIATSDVTILKTSENISKHAKIFITRVLSKFSEKYAYGYKISNDRLKKQPIMLPIDSSGDPNWKFMEEYVKQAEKRQGQLVLDYCKEQLDRCLATLRGDVTSRENVKWKAFKIEDVFEINSGIRLTKKDQQDGKIPFVGASDSNNGITAFVSNINSSIDKNVLGVNYNGSVVYNFYHPYTALFSDDVKRLHLKNVSYEKREVYLFLKQMIFQQRVKYAYGYKFNGERMKAQPILLPATMQGTPDFRFMECFILQEEAKLYKKIIARFEKNKRH